MTQALVLKVTANGTTTSPVLRGKWIVERLLGREIPLPPPVTRTSGTTLTRPSATAFTAATNAVACGPRASACAWA